MLNEKGGHFSLKWASFTRHGKALTASSYYQRLKSYTSPITTRAADTRMVTEVQSELYMQRPHQTHTELEKNFLHLVLSGK